MSPADTADGRGRLWWVALERLIAAVNTLDVEIDGVATRIDASSPIAKQDAFNRIHDWLQGLPSDIHVQHAVSSLCARHGIDDAVIARELCMSWDELKPFANDPLVTIGAHTISHCNLAKETEADAWREMRVSREQIEAMLQKPALHFAYPYGYKTAATARIRHRAPARIPEPQSPARRHDLSENANHLTALPRISLNGNYQNTRFLSVLTSGAATAMWNGFRRVDAA